MCSCRIAYWGDCGSGGCDISVIIISISISMVSTMISTWDNNTSSTFGINYVIRTTTWGGQTQQLLDIVADAVLLGITDFQ